ncbi:hypothetical protein DB313_05700 (plasmid) [Borrelia turcica IST7]|uniref:Uncharacterized protein n=1 Tax=Borrelia turcica IST7 TaxID=1104446 RepID=A0A386PQ47_9SPIR|nr:hypothetical protein [Borrelia turcica]AYE36993.1 hypothetical protein DB313_05700 [Borrelia turcica IST7]
MKFNLYFLIPLFLLFIRCLSLELFQANPKPIEENYKINNTLTIEDLTQEEYDYYLQRYGEEKNIKKYYLSDFAEEYSYNLYSIDMYLLNPGMVIRIPVNREIVFKEFQQHGFILLKQNFYSHIDHVPLFKIIKADEYNKMFKLAQSIEKKQKKKNEEYEKLEKLNGLIKNNPFSLITLKDHFINGKIKENDIIYIEGYFDKLKASRLILKNLIKNKSSFVGYSFDKFTEFEVTNHDSNNIKNIMNKLQQNTEYLIKAKYLPKDEEMKQYVLNIEIIEIYGPDSNGYLELLKNNNFLS